MTVPDSIAAQRGSVVASGAAIGARVRAWDPRKQVEDALAQAFDRIRSIPARVAASRLGVSA